MNAVLLIVAIIFLTSPGVSWKIFNKHFAKNQTDAYAFNSILCGFTAIIFLISGFDVSAISMTSLLIGTGFGISYALCLLLYSKALATGPLSYTALFMSSSLIIPAIFGITIWKESMSIFQIVGVVLLLASFVVGLNKNDSTESGMKNKKKWLVFSLLVFATNGILSVFQKLHTSILHGAQVNEFLTISFCVAAVFMICLTMFQVKTTKIPISFKLTNYKILILGILTAFCGGFGNKLIVILSTSIPANILYPIANGGTLILASIAAVVIFKDKLSNRQILGLALGSAAIALISNIF